MIVVSDRGGIETGKHIAISIINASKKYHPEVPLLENFSLGLEYGEIVVIAGPSGSGKSTILQIASALLSPDSGEITVNGVQLFPRKIANRKKKDDLMRSLISYVAQEDYLFDSLSVFENVALSLDLRGETEERDKRVEQALKDVKIDQLRERRISEISSGERRRCALARGLVKDPSIFIADEPTSSLDIELTMDFMKLLESKRKSKGMAILIASHDVAELGPFADQVYEIQNHTLLKSQK